MAFFSLEEEHGKSTDVGKMESGLGRKETSSSLIDFVHTLCTCITKIFGDSCKTMVC